MLRPLLGLRFEVYKSKKKAGETRPFKFVVITTEGRKLLPYQHQRLLKEFCCRCI